MKEKKSKNISRFANKLWEKFILENLELLAAVPTFSRFSILVSSGTGFVIPVSEFLISAKGSFCAAVIFSKIFAEEAVERQTGAPLPT